MASTLRNAGGFQMTLLCIALALSSLKLQGCSTNDEQVGRGPMPEAAALEKLNQVREKCSAKCKDKCNYKETDFEKHMKEFDACHSCLDTSCKEEFKKVYRQVDQHWYEPACMTATLDADKCWSDGSDCLKLMEECWNDPAETGCDIEKIEKIDKCWIDHTNTCMEKYLPCWTKGGANASTNYCDNMPSFVDFLDPFDPGMTDPFDPGMPNPVLTDDDCKARYYGLNYSYSFEGGSEVKSGCCKLKSASKCTIINFPKEAGAIDAGKTFDCKKKSS